LTLRDAQKWESIMPVRRRGRGFGSTVSAFALALSAGLIAPVFAQTQPLRPGEAFVTRFSGVANDGATPRIDPNGAVGVIIGVSSPSEPPNGQHWISKSIRSAVTAAEVGQVFGVALDDQSPPNVYLTASSAFGLHRAQGGWMEGMWGRGGGPGTLWRLEAANGYRAAPIANIAAMGRPNSGAALGNIAYDRIHRQVFVSDMESGLLVRLSRDGRQLGVFDHGGAGRPAFLDAETNQRAALAPIPLDPARQARLDDCHGLFDQTPSCWNFAPSGRRIWGVGVRRDPMGEGAQVYYAVWSSPAFEDASWSAMSDDDKRNAVWSVRLRPDGDFDPTDVRREFILPDFFVSPGDVSRAGYSQPVSDITFSECGERPVMLVAERGGVRNLGLGVENAFATPGEARTLRYELDQRGVWRPVGRYDVGNDDRRSAGPPHINANCAGGAAFGPDIRDPLSPTARDQGPDAYVWITGDNLCAPNAPCRLPSASVQPASTQGGETFDADPSHVHGVQGHRADLLSEVAPATSNDQTRQGASPALEAAYLIDVDRVLDERGLMEAELTRNDATLTGDIAVYQVCLPPPPPRAAAPGIPWVNPTYLIPLPPAGYVVPGHAPDWSHAQWASHGARTSHFRYGSHNPAYSHQRWRSHQPNWSHSRTQSHNSSWSHNRVGSHNRWISGGHDERRSHAQHRSHATSQSHNPRISQGHSSNVSSGHDRRISWHSTQRSQGHNPTISHGHSVERSQAHTTSISQGHNPTISQGHSVDRSQGHDPVRSIGANHNPVLSRGPVHDAQISRQPIHNRVVSSRPIHTVAVSRGGHQTSVSRRPTHNPTISSRPIHTLAISRAPTHNPRISLGTAHNSIASRGPTHNPRISAGPSHNPTISRGPAHNPRISAGQAHNPRISRGPVHNSVASRGPVVRQPDRPRVQPPRVQQPRAQQQRVQQPRAQQQRIAPQRQPQSRDRRSETVR
jgi:hypothetical protein